jgi:tripartite ATP-independent transporter DctM subunit
MVLYGVTTNTSIKDLFIAGIIPGILLGGAFMVTSYIFARIEGHPVDEKFEVKRLGTAFWAAIVPLLIPVLVVGGLIGGFVTPTEAAALGVVAALIFGLGMRRDLDSKKVYGLAATTVRQTSVVMMIIAGSAVLGQFLANEQIPQKIAEGLGELTDSFVLRMLLINMFLLFLGMFLHASAAIIVVVPMLLPLSQQMGIDPVHFGVIVCLNLGIGQQTPPVASVLLTVCSATGLRIEQVMGYVKWYILAMFITLMIVSFIPITALVLL